VDTFENPFAVKAYLGPEYFCDREKELAKILSAVRSNRNLVIMSPRRMGKTGLIRHVQYHLQKKRIPCFYVDIFGTTSLKELIQLLAKNILGKMDSRPERALKLIHSTFASLRPSLELDEMTGMPSLTFDLQQRQATQSTLEQIFQYLENQKRQVVIALDEFQQITQYKEKNIEAILRSIVQHSKYVRFIFSGSHQQIMGSMFGSHNRPFYQSAEILPLDIIPKQSYSGFILHHFKQGRKKITEASAEYILDWARNHTYYIQALCSRLYSNGEKIISEDLIRETIVEILQENEAINYSFRNLLAPNQWKLLIAIALEDGVEQPNHGQFISKYDLGQSSSVRRALESLIKKEFVFLWQGKYAVYDLFLSKWLKWRY